MAERETLVERLRAGVPPVWQGAPSACATLQEAADHIEALEARIRELEAGREPVAWRVPSIECYLCNGTGQENGAKGGPHHPRCGYCGGSGRIHALDLAPTPSGREP